MKKLLTLLFVAFCAMSLNAQEKSLYEELSGVKKKTDKFNFYMNMNGSFDAMFNDNGFDNGKFNMRQLRIEAKGNINEWLSYRWRQRLNRPNDGSDNIDNLPTSIDIAGIGVKLGDKFSIFAGKQCAAYGGFEFDANPIEIYEYSDMIEYMSNFMTGINIGYDFMEGQQLNFQVLNSLNGDFGNMYGFDDEDGELIMPILESLNITPSKLPLVYTLNWNGNFANIYKTRWSASIMSQAEGKNLYYFALGNELTLGKFNMYLDFMYSNDAIDRAGIVTNIVGTQNGHNILDASYFSIVTKLNYRFAEKWNVFVKGMYETASLYKEYNEIEDVTPVFEKGKYRTSLGYLGGIEYYPMESNLHFFLTYVGRHYIYNEACVNRADYSNRVSVGFIYQLPMF